MTLFEMNVFSVIHCASYTCEYVDSNYCNLHSFENYVYVLFTANNFHLKVLTILFGDVCVGWSDVENVW